MLAEAGKPFDSPRHFFEPKLDGTRCICFLDRAGGTRLQNRRLADITYRYPELQSLHLGINAQRVILDGEIVVFRGGRPDFQKLQEREHVEDPFKTRLLSERVPATYVVFDILYLNGADLTKKPLGERKKILAGAVKQSAYLMLCPFVEGRGKKFFREALRRGFEGIMAKERKSPYLAGERSKFWLKIKKEETVDAVVCGWLEGKGRRKKYFASLVLGAYKKRRLVHLGNVGTGFDEKSLEWVMEALKKISADKSPFAGRVSFTKPVHWVKPFLVCVVSFMDWTRDEKLRAPRFKGLRFDKPAKECVV